MKTIYQKGDRVRAFHPRMFGVVKVGTVRVVGRKYIHVDFGDMLGGTFKLNPQDIVSHEMSYLFG